jgi:Rad3-related DNA helicase
MKNYNQPEFLPKLGDAIVRIVEGIPHGGVLIFLPSYSLLRKCEKAWNPNSFGQNRRGWWSQNDQTGDGNSVWDRLEALKHKVIVEPSGNQDLFEEKKEEYMETVRTNKGCVLLAVYRGKMSEGISFNDNYARGVICIGLPLPSAFALDIKVKMNYNDEQRMMRKRTDLLPGREWYNQQAYRAIAQALGRCIR